MEANQGPLDRWVERQNVIPTHKGMLLSLRKEGNSPVCHNMEPVTKRQVMYDSTYMWRRQWHPTPVLLPGKSHGRRSPVGCSPWDRTESDTTERLHFHFSLSCIGEGNGNPLQGSCLENPRDGGAWWAAIYGVAQSQTRLKWLSSSSHLHEALRAVKSQK